MSTKSIPEQLHRSLQEHLEQSDIREDEELTELLGKLSTLSAKVAAAKAQVLAKRQQKAGEKS